MAGNTQNRDISSTQAQRITAEAATWKETAYALVGAASTKGVSGDCSGTTFKIYRVAGFPFDYQQSAGFPAYAQRSGRFRKIGPGEAKQDGDILSWNNHMAIYAAPSLQNSDDATTARVSKSGKPWTQTNDIWTATRPQGPAFMPAALKYWRSDPPAVYRYQVDP